MPPRLLPLPEGGQTRSPGNPPLAASSAAHPVQATHAGRVDQPATPGARTSGAATRTAAGPVARIPLAVNRGPARAGSAQVPPDHGLSAPRQTSPDETPHEDRAAHR